MTLTEFFVRAATLDLDITQAFDTIFPEVIDDFINMYHEAALTVFEAILRLDTDTFEAIHNDRGDANPGVHLWMWLYTTITIVLFAGLYLFVLDWWNVWEVGNVGHAGVERDMRMEVRRCLRLPSFGRGVDDRFSQCGFTGD